MSMMMKKQSAVAPARQTRRPSVQVFAAKAAKASAGPSMVCMDCGYIYDGKASFASLPESYKCPVCKSPKKRFAPPEEASSSLLLVTAGSTVALLVAFAFLSGAIKF